VGGSIRVGEWNILRLRITKGRVCSIPESRRGAHDLIHTVHPRSTENKAGRASSSKIECLPLPSSA